jgi:hypothetical protein
LIYDHIFTIYMGHSYDPIPSWSFMVAVFEESKQTYMCLLALVFLVRANEDIRVFY